MNEGLYHTRSWDLKRQGQKLRSLVFVEVWAERQVRPTWNQKLSWNLATKVRSRGSSLCQTSGCRR